MSEGGPPKSDRGSVPSGALVGIAGSVGVVIAPALVLGNNKVRFRRRRVAVGAEGAEWERYGTAVRQVQADLRHKLEALDVRSPEGSILEAYLLMVGDEILADRVREQIHERRRSAEWAVAGAIESFTERLAHVDDVYIRERSHDIEFVGDLLLRALGGVNQVTHLNITEPCVVVARDLSPADTASMIGAPVKAFVTEVGSRTSHTSIMARALEIPAVVGVQDALQRIGTGDLLIVDALRGLVYVDPTPEMVEEAEARAGRYASMTRKLGETRDLAASTQDGTRIYLKANIELPEETRLAREHGAEGVGLYRTEFLYVNRIEPPTEEEQLAIFKRVLAGMEDRGVTLRTFDIGGDKFATTFRLPGELNPMLGLRAVRLALTELDVFRAHLRAMVRASAFGDVRIMLPLVSNLNELRTCRQLLQDVVEEVRREGHEVADEIPLGVMIEVPAAAVMADVFAAEADFMSIGTNDLVQYALAIDRTNRNLAHLASPYDPAILRLVEGVIAAGRRQGCPVSVCGEMASEPYGALMLIGLGVRDLSMEAVAIPEIKAAIGRVSLRELEAIAKRGVAMTTAGEVEEMLDAAFEPRLHDIITHQPESAPGQALTPAFGVPRVAAAALEMDDPGLALAASLGRATGDFGEEIE
ncbi:MAG: phosphoenolpyruvate--protein phosphotransferase [Myxococcales bacterium]|nr:phosphoenolpyruvate--protein phosphotransferase [Myxococcales bacterium]